VKIRSKSDNPVAQWDETMSDTSLWVGRDDLDSDDETEDQESVQSDMVLRDLGIEELPTPQFDDEFEDQQNINPPPTTFHSPLQTIPEGLNSSHPSSATNSQLQYDY